MRKIQTSDIKITAIAAVVLSVISIPYLDWWGLLVGPAMVLMFAWAYYSMALVVWIGSSFKKLIGRA
ncbi:hypothetical protein [Pantoea anthophila]|uniref:hypothetical protein n=1 Tax=Pantoea anthophila TaxID=470931 RepID=UPI002DB9638B|nr:hypothetical protein [Pantoea anthophila]MEB5707361.1 hypothetical protein [Pantoea anthophila]MEB6518232.1 hypothetical protein [Pantoea anthophila]